MVPILVAIIAASGLLIGLMTLAGRKNNGGGGGGSRGERRPARPKNRSVVIRECTRKLARDPHNIGALLALGDLYATELNYEKALPLYLTLFGMLRTHPEIDAKLVSVRFGICSYRLQKPDDAVRGLAEALKLDSKNYEANFYMAKVMYEKKEYEKALLCIRRAMLVSPENSEAIRILGNSLYQLKKFRDSLPYLKRIVDENPSDKEALFFIASAMEETGMVDKALKVFMHLRTDPVYGPQSCIECGVIHSKMKQDDKAIADYEIALKLENVPQETTLNIYYKLAHAHLGQQDIGKALQYLKQIQSLTPTYKDVNALIARYQELNSNDNLRRYLMSGQGEFVALCRKFVSEYYRGSYVKVEDIAVNSDSVDVMCTVETTQWEDSVLFRFFRSTGSVGDYPVRDFYAKIQDTKTGRGFCLTPGSFSTEAHKYTEGRSIELIDKQKLIPVLKKIDTGR